MWDFLMETRLTRFQVTAALLLSGALSGCASTEGVSQDIQLSVMPQMARCDAYEQGNFIGTYDATRQTITVPTSRGSLDIRCSAPGYKDKRVAIVSESGWGVAGFLLGDFGPVSYATIRFPMMIQITMDRA
jgi:predicted small secreted protein